MLGIFFFLFSFFFLLFLGCLVLFSSFKFLWRQFHSSLVLISRIFQIRPNSLVLFCRTVWTVCPAAHRIIKVGKDLQNHQPLTMLMSIMLWFLQCRIYCANREFKSGAKWFGRPFPRTGLLKLLLLLNSMHMGVLSSSPAVNPFPDFCCCCCLFLRSGAGGKGEVVFLAFIQQSNVLYYPGFIRS